MRNLTAATINRVFMRVKVLLREDHQAEIRQDKSQNKEDNQQQKYLSSWQSYRDEIRKKIGQTTGTILIEDQTETYTNLDKSIKMKKSQSRQINIDNSANNQLLFNTTKNAREQFQRPSSSIDRCDSLEGRKQQKQFVAKNNIINQESQINKVVNQTVYDNSSKFKNSLGNDQTKSHIDNLFKKYLGSPGKRRVESTISPNKQPQVNQRDYSNQILSNNAESKNLYQNVRDSLGVKQSKILEEKNLVHSPSAKVFSTDIFNTTSTSNNIRGQELSKDHPYNRSILTNKNEKTSKYQSNTNSSAQSQRLMNFEFSQGQNQNTTLNKTPVQIPNLRPLSSLEEKLNSLKSQISNENTPIKRQTFTQKTQNDNSNFSSKQRDLREELENYKQLKSYEHTSNFNETDLSVMNKSRLNNNIINTELSQQKPPMSHRQYYSTTEVSPLKSQNLNMQVSFKQSQHLEVFPQQQITELNQYLKQFQLNKEAINSNLPLGYLKDLEALQNTINTILAQTSIQPTKQRQSFINTNKNQENCSNFKSRELSQTDRNHKQFTVQANNHIQLNKSSGKQNIQIGSNSFSYTGSRHDQYVNKIGGLSAQRML
eukprot:403345952